MPELFPHQREGALFLANRKTALLADEQRVGKTAAAIVACDYVLARKILIVTTASARANWGREFRDWQAFPRSVHVEYTTGNVIPDDDVVVIGWSAVADRRIFQQLRAIAWDALILDEGHYAKNPEAKRTVAMYGKNGLHLSSDIVWPLTGTPIPNAPNDLWPMLNALAPERIDSMSYDKFVDRYCVVRKKFIAPRRSIDVVVGGKNTDELAKRLDGFWLRRTQKDVGIRPPIYSVFSVETGGFNSGPIGEELRRLDGRMDDILEAAEAGDRTELDVHLGTLRRLTGLPKAYAVAEVVKEEFEAGLDKIVLMCWHKDTLAVLRDRLSEFGVVGIEGATSPATRQTEVDEFQRGTARVFVGQILAAGEAIDLSASANLMFVEPSFVPKDMAQAALRITNHSQKRQCFVRVAALAGSIDEAVMAILTRKVATIRQVMKD